MNTRPNRIEFTRIAGSGGGFSVWPENPAVRYLSSGFNWLAAVLMVGFGACVLLSGYPGNAAKGEPAQLAKASAPELAQSPTIDAAQDGASFRIATTPEEAFTPTEIAPVEGLKIASQSWRRGGLGSNALVTFTLRNGNDYAVKDIEISCAFTRRDGSHLTDRKRMIHDAVNMKSRKTFARMHVGFVNVNADQAKCSLVTASRI